MSDLTDLLPFWLNFRVLKLQLLGDHVRLTRRLALAAAECCVRLPVAHVAKMFGLHWSTVRCLDNQRLQAQVASLPPAQPDA